jgi:hypothetical protein
MSGSNNNAIDQFLTPEAMLTPGVLGSLTMMITNALTQHFYMERAWLGLGLSFLFGLLVLVTARSILVRSVFYLMNSLVIFCMAAGANGLGAGAAQRVSFSLTTTAYAQDSTPPYCANLPAAVDAAQKANQPPEKIVAMVKACQTQNRPSTAASGKFFSPWKF